MSYLLSYLEEAVAALWRNRVRSALTMLGMIIGSSSIIAVFGISHAATAGITNTFSSFGELPLFVQVDGSATYPQRAAMHYRDTAAVAEALGDQALDVQPFWQRTYKVAFGNVHDFEQIVSDGGFHNDSLAMSEGRRFTQADINAASRVCIMTQDLARKYFGNAAAVGNFISVNGQRCEIVGVYADIKGSFMNSLISNTSITIPYTTFYSDFDPGDLDNLIVYPADQTQADALGNETKAALQHVHGDKAAYIIQNGAGFITSFDGVLNIIAIGLSAIGGVALVVAGIGIMNIMLVSVTERTREIGIRKAIGANRGNIILQFLMEAVVLSIIGGGIGMGLGILVTVGAASILSKQLGELLIPYLLIVSIALGFSIAIGMVFGTYPAVRAANLDPIEALRS
jgi:putative ABC transport system permease protein